MQPPSGPTPEQYEARLRLDAEVEKIKQLESEGKRTPLATAQERYEALNASQNILDLGMAIREALPILQGLAIKSKKFREDWLEWYCNDAPRAPLCVEHNIPLLVNQEASIVKSWKVDEMKVVYDECELCYAVKNRASSSDQWIKIGIPQKVLHATFDNFNLEDAKPYQETARKVVKKFCDQAKLDKGFIVAMGNFGTGKSHLAAATIKQAGSGMFVTEADLIGELRQTYSDNTGQDKLVEKYRTAKVLVLDEVSDEIRGIDIPNLLYRILGYRHDHDLLTVITSNNKLPEVLAILGPKLADRMTQNYVVCNFTWDSHRKKANVNE